MSLSLNTRMLIHDMKKSLKRRGLEENGEVQKFIDTEVIRLSEPYTPFDSGYLKNDAPKLKTQIGSGLIKYAAPYAKKQYYENSGRSGGRRGKLWFQRMKVDHKDDILRGAATIAGGKADDN